MISKVVHDKARMIIQERHKLRDCFVAGICPDCGARLKEIVSSETSDYLFAGVDAFPIIDMMKCIACKFRVQGPEYKEVRDGH